MIGIRFTRRDKHCKHKRIGKVGNVRHTEPNKIFDKPYVKFIVRKVT